MITLPDRVRAAAEATAHEVTPDGIPDWEDLANRTASGRERRVPVTRRHVRARWLAPVTAAAAVLAVAAGLAGGLSGTARPSPASSAARIGPLPRYYALIVAVHGTCRLVIHDARSGATLVTARLAPGQYDQITAAADDTTFVIGQQGRTGPMSFLLARFDPARDTITVHKLPIAPVPAAEATNGIALSPDGTELAVTTRIVDAHDDTNAPGEIRLYSLATGAVKEWTTSADWGNLGLVSWGSDGILGFDFFTMNPADATRAGIRLLNTNAPAGNLLADSTLAVPQAQPAGYLVQGPIALIDNGAAVVTIAERSQHRKVVSRFEVLSTRTGRATRTFLPSRPGGALSLVWASAAGTVLAGYFSSGSVEWISGARHTPVSGVPASGFLAIAF
jgi:hypothetical protein